LRGQFTEIAMDLRARFHAKKARENFRDNRHGF
jgi:hypothetical protein